jgi:hypothetical protein
MSSSGQAVNSNHVNGKANRPSLGIYVDPVQGGLIVNSVTPCGLSDMYGIEAGDVILAVNGKPSPSTDDLKSAVKGAHGNHLFTVQVAGKGGGVFDFEFLLPLGEPEVRPSPSFVVQDFLCKGMHLTRGASFSFHSFRHIFTGFLWSATSLRVFTSSQES